MSALTLLSAGYLLGLFLLAEAVERGPALRRWAGHPLVTALSLGAYVSSWSYFGAVVLARTDGWAYTRVFLGAALSALAIPLVWRPLYELLRHEQLSSPADLFAFRFRSPALGLLVSGLVLSLSVPYLALQLEAIVRAIHALGGSQDRRLLGLGLCVGVALFAVRFGAGRARAQAPQPGLVAALAAETGVKLGALLFLGALAWQLAPGAPLDLARPSPTGAWSAQLLLFSAAAFLLPQQFHLAFTVNPSPRGLRWATWLMPLLMLAFALPALPILAAAERLNPGAAAGQLWFALAERSPTAAFATVLGGLAAGTGAMIAAGLAVSAMLTHHVLLPGWRPRGDLRLGLVVARGSLTALFFGLVYAFFFFAVDAELHPESIGLSALIGLAQLLPGLLGTLAWPRMNRAGVLAGLSAGGAVWALLSLAPLLGFGQLQDSLLALSAAVDPSWSDPASVVTVLSLGLNFGLAIGLSLIRPQRPEELQVALRCLDREQAEPPAPRELASTLAQLTEVLGAQTAEAALLSALGEHPPEQLSRLELSELRERLHAHLSGLVGPQVAQLAMGDSERPSILDRLLFLDRRDAAKLSPQAARIEVVRRYLRRLLEDLPVGVVVLNASQDILLWNRAIAELTQTPSERCLGLRLSALPPELHALGELLGGWLSHPEPELQAELRREEEVLHLQVARTPLQGPEGEVDTVLIVFDRTAHTRLEAHLAHQSRLIAVGQLAAGVAHELGNPLSGILMVAKNLAREAEPEDLPERLGWIVEEAEQIERIVSTLIGFARGPQTGRTSNLTVVPVRGLLEDAVQLIRLSRKPDACQMELGGDPALAVYGDAAALRQVLVNLLDNACDAAGPGARVRLDAEARGRRVRISVQDDGPGMDPQVLARVFDPFFTTKPPGSGSGLGLAIVYSIIERHGGDCGARAKPGQGTTMWVELSRVEAT